MRVLLVNPFSVVQKSWMPYPPHEPLALEYLAAVASNDHEVNLLDCRGAFLDEFEALPNGLFHAGASLKQIKTFITNWKPELVGITLPFATQISSVYSIINLVKEIDKGIITVIGGCTASSYPQQILKQNQNIDIVVVGEGELTFQELLEGKEMNRIDGIVYRNENKAISNSPRHFIENLDEIPFPRRDLVPFENYSKYRFGKGRFKRGAYLLRTRGIKHVVKRVFTKTHRSLFGKDDFHQRIPKYDIEAKILTSRGCPFNCYFCAVHNVWRRTYRMRSAENVLEEMELLYEKYKVRHFGIVDDNFNISKKRTIEICKGIIERGLEVTLRADSGLYLSSIDEETLLMMKKAGFHELYFGIESGNERILKDVIGKKVDLEQVKEVARLCKDLGIVSGGFFMIGVPGETKETMEDTINFAISSNLDRIRMYTCQPFPGSKLYEDSKENGWLTTDFDVSKTLVFESKSYIQTKDFSPEDVAQISKKGKAILRKQRRLDMEE
jgi:anaerobic magnesium-protoporphyrin IX monomethyl ester cyclase